MRNTKKKKIAKMKGTPKIKKPTLRERLEEVKARCVKLEAENFQMKQANRDLTKRRDLAIRDANQDRVRTDSILAMNDLARKRLKDQAAELADDRLMARHLAGQINPFLRTIVNTRGCYVSPQLADTAVVLEGLVEHHANKIDKQNTTHKVAVELSGVDWDASLEKTVARSAELQDRLKAWKSTVAVEGSSVKLGKSWTKEERQAQLKVAAGNVAKRTMESPEGRAAAEALAGDPEDSVGTGGCGGP